MNRLAHKFTIIQVIHQLDSCKIWACSRCFYLDLHRRVLGINSRMKPAKLSPKINLIGRKYNDKLGKFLINLPTSDFVDSRYTENCACAFGSLQM